MVETKGPRVIFPEAADEQVALIKKLAADLELKEEDFVPEAVPFSPNTNFESEEMKIRAILRELFIHKWDSFYKNNPDKAPLFYGEIVGHWAPQVKDGEIQIREGFGGLITRGAIDEVKGAEQIIELLTSPDYPYDWEKIIVWELGDMLYLRPELGKFLASPEGRLVLFPDEVRQLAEGAVVTILHTTNFNEDALIEERKEVITLQDGEWLMKIEASLIR